MLWPEIWDLCQNRRCQKSWTWRTTTLALFKGVWRTCGLTLACQRCVNICMEISQQKYRRRSNSTSLDGFKIWLQTFAAQWAWKEKVLQNDGKICFFHFFSKKIKKSQKMKVKKKWKSGVFSWKSGVFFRTLIFCQFCAIFEHPYCRHFASRARVFGAEAVHPWSLRMSYVSCAPGSGVAAPWARGFLT